MKNKSFNKVGGGVSFIVLGWLMASCGSGPKEPSPQVVSPTSVTYITDSKESEPTYQGRSISQWFQSETEIKTDQLSLKELLTLKQVTTGDEPDIVTFELPISYDAITNLGALHLGGINRDGEFVERCMEDCERATNGHCLLAWNINYDPPGKHNMRARLICENPKLLHWDAIAVIGPALTFYSSNACQFFESGSMFDDKGAYLDAKLREQVATYRIELKTAKGKHIKTITGSTTNGMIESDWDLADEHGKNFKEDSFDGFFYVTYPGETLTNAPARKNFNRLGGG